jgi:hypothetical protein
VYSVLTPGKLEGGQVAIFNPSQYRYLAYPTLSGNSTGG